jgi:O-antigen/teichoic acid export membrane protein
MNHATTNNGDCEESRPGLRRLVARPMKWGSRLINALGGSHGRRAALALIDQFIVAGVNFITILLLGRLAGPDSLGMFALVLSVYYLFLALQESLITVPFTMLSVQLKGVRRLQYSGAALCQSAALSALVAGCLILAAATVLVVGGDASLARVIAVFGIVSPLWLIREFGRRYLFSQLQVTKVMVTSIVGGCIQLVVLCILGYSGNLSAVTALVAVGVGSGIVGFGCLWFSRAEFRFNRRRWPQFAQKNWMMGRWLIACQAMDIIAQGAIPWLIWFWLGPVATGIFAACDTIIRFANPVITSLNNLFVPRIAHGFNDGGKVELNRLVWKATALLAIFLTTFCILLALAGEWFLSRSFGTTYMGYSATLVVLGISQLVGRCGIGLAPAAALWLLQRANIILLAIIAGFVASLAVTPVLLPHYGSLGAALALLCGNLVYSALIVGNYVTLMRDGSDESLTSICDAIAIAAPAGSAVE